jgi:hypothetical protein
MKATRQLLLWLAAILALAMAPAWAQKGKGPVYDPKTETTVEGVVTGKVEVPWGASDCWGGEHLVVKAEKETVQVHVGPTWYLARNGWRFAEGDRVVVAGSRIKVEGVEALIARRVERGGQTLELRSADGAPVWTAKKKK